MIKKIPLITILLLLFTAPSLFASPEKLALFKPIVSGNFKTLKVCEDYIILFSDNGNLFVYSANNEEFTLLKYYSFRFKFPDSKTQPIVFQNILYAPSTKGILIFDISNLPEITFKNTLKTNTPVKSLAIKNKIMAVAYFEKKQIKLFTLENPENPEEASIIETENSCGDFLFLTDKLLITTSDNNKDVTIWDISNIEQPQRVNSFVTNTISSCLLIEDKYLLLKEANTTKNFIIDLSNPEQIPNLKETNINLNWRYGYNLDNYVLLIDTNSAAFINKNDFTTPEDMDCFYKTIDFNLTVSDILKIGENKYKMYSIDNKDTKGVFLIEEQTQKIEKTGNLDYASFKCPGPFAKIDNFLYIPNFGKGISIFKIYANGIPKFVKNETFNKDNFLCKGVWLIQKEDSKTVKDYLISWDNEKIYIIGIDDYENLNIISQIDRDLLAFSFKNPYLYVISTNNISIIDLSYISSPQEISSIEVSGNHSKNIYLHNDYLFYENYIINVSDKNNPQLLSDSFDAFFVAGIENFLVSISNSDKTKLNIYNISNPENPEKIEEIEIGEEINTIYSLFQQNGYVVCVYDSTYATNSQTLFLSLNEQSIKPSYVIDGSIIGFAFATKYLYATQESGIPFGIFGKNLIVPHIATTWGWETNIIADNMLFEREPFTFYLNDTIRIKQEDLQAGELQQISIPVKKGQTADLCIPFDSPLSFKVSYHHLEEHGIAEFLLDSHVSRETNMLIPQYLQNKLTWSGIALANNENQKGLCYLKAFDSNGNLLDKKEITSYPLERYVATLNNIFPEITWREISKVSVFSSIYNSGLTISGNGNSQLLFTSATYKKNREDTRFLPHIDIKGFWDNYLILDNPTLNDITVNIKLYSEGNTVISENKTITPNSNLIIDLNNYSQYNVDCGEISGCGKDLIVRLSYMFKSTGATAEFLIDGDNTSSCLAFNLPAYRNDILTWYGIAIMNPDNIDKDVVLKAYANGREIGKTTIHLEKHSKLAALVKDLFNSLTGQNVERIIASTQKGNIVGLNISGANQDRYLFSPAIAVKHNCNEKIPLEGLVTMGSVKDLRNGQFDVLKEANIHPDIYSGVVIRTTWGELEPERGKFNFSSIEKALEDIRHYNELHPEHKLGAKLRISTAINPPEWVLNLAGGPVEVVINEDLSYLIGLFWTKEYTQAWRELQIELAKKFDSEPLMREVCITSPSMATDEPLATIFNKATIQNLKEKGFTDKDFKEALEESLEVYSCWKQTLIDFSFNIFREIDSGKPVNNPEYTIELINKFREKYGERAVMSNHGLQENLTAGALTVFQAFAELESHIAAQTKGPGDLTDNTIKLGLEFGVREFEIWDSIEAGGYADFTIEDLERWQKLIEDNKKSNNKKGR